jgi:hypothetical protein
MLVSPERTVNVCVVPPVGGTIGPVGSVGDGRRFSPQAKALKASAKTTTNRVLRMAMFPPPSVDGAKALSCLLQQVLR